MGAEAGRAGGVKALQAEKVETLASTVVEAAGEDGDPLADWIHDVIKRKSLQMVALPCGVCKLPQARSTSATISHLYVSLCASHTAVHVARTQQSLLNGYVSKNIYLF